ncbi:GNAT family N-acetyltransferase [Kitasatospora sp. NPDC002227]|uniref:GNAT family N-acetyltransferase n=1 Tax=Kitasatospora sp. NPDC002227 TaxID=3154773 RepID=UPI003332582D
MGGISTEHYRPGTVPAAELRELTAMFEEVAGEFVPPLTERRDTTQADLTGGAGGGGAGDYLQEMLRQDLILCRNEGQAVGFLSYRADHVDQRYPELCPCLYVSTVAVRHEHRRFGIARALYQALFDLPPSAAPWVVLRTWSTNTGHLRLLDSLGFRSVLRIPDDREPGVDTLYLATDRSKQPAAR